MEQNIKKLQLKKQWNLNRQNYHFGKELFYKDLKATSFYYCLVLPLSLKLFMNVLQEDIYSK